jgi:hypothetical protein
MDPVRRVNDILDEAANHAIGPAQVAKIEEAVRLADSIHDDALRFGARIELVTSATFAGMPERSLVAFAWLLAKADAEPERFDVEQLLFPYRWIVEDIPYLLSVSTERVDALIDDMAVRYDRHWWWEHPVWEARMRWGMVRGAPKQEVEAHYRRWRREFARAGNPRGGHEVHASVIVLNYLGRFGEAVKEAGPAIDGTLPHEEEYPARTFAAVMRSGRSIGHPDCASWRSRAAELCTGNQVFIREVAAIVHDFVADGEPPPANLVSVLVTWLQTSRDEHGIMLASAALAGAKDGLAHAGDNHRARAQALASRFDARHENHFVSTQVRTLLLAGSNTEAT